MKRLFYLALFVIATMLFSCKDSSQTLVGKWNIVDIHQEAQDSLTDLTIPTVIFGMQTTGVSYVEFTKDNEYHVFDKENQIIETQKYSIDKNKLSIQGKDGKVDVMEIICKNEQDNLVDLKSENDIVVTLKKIEK
ncbi:MAG: lipocalin family protein [Bacteroidales bacterium]|jgi:hypothetical protein|nr:lipocalin family protein [Bacteroidales bacterium]MDD3693762.1 lipocalin family protein [Oscillospiraceae bacterium]MCK9256273.1 lipocalin family protein [Bacteroidales bacterium]MCK9499058.1 lipocalin family protein [Bacteroidales bacterium]MDY0315895.1 lipocalin family protein [Bacteroidales bacterium]